MFKKEIKTNLIIVLSGVALVVFSGALIFSHLEKWSFINSLYFVIMTATTVGYGDLTPTTHLTKIITMIYALSIIPFMLYIFSIIAEFESQHVYKKIQHIEQKQEAHEEDIEKTVKKLEEQRHKLKAQEEALERQEKKLKSQSKELDVHEKEIEVEEKELEVVEEIVGSALASKN